MPRAAALIGGYCHLSVADGDVVLHQGPSASRGQRELLDDVRLRWAAIVSAGPWQSGAACRAFRIRVPYSATLGWWSTHGCALVKNAHPDGRIRLAIAANSDQATRAGMAIAARLALVVPRPESCASRTHHTLQQPDPCRCAPATRRLATRRRCCLRTSAAWQSCYIPDTMCVVPAARCIASISTATVTQM